MTTVAHSSRPRPRPTPNVYDDGQIPARQEVQRPDTLAPSPNPDTACPKKLPSRTMQQAMHLPEAGLGRDAKVVQEQNVDSKRSRIKRVVKKAARKAGVMGKRQKTEANATSNNFTTAHAQAVNPTPAKKPTRIDRKTLARQISEAVDSALLYSLLHTEDLQQTRQRAADAISDHFNLPHHQLPQVDDLQKIESRLEKLQNQIELFANAVERAQSAMLAAPSAAQPHIQAAVQAVPQPLHSAITDGAESASPYDDLLRRLLEENIKLSRNENA